MKGLAFAFLAFIGLVTAATASSSPADPIQVPKIKVKEGTSTNWSGYAIPVSGGVTDVIGSWKVPSVTCGSSSTSGGKGSKKGSGSTGNSYSSVWVGIDGDNSNTVEQTGTEQDCINGQPRYAAWYEMYPKFPYNLPASSYPVAAGDTITAEVSTSGSGQFTLSLVSSHGWTFRTTQKLASARLSSAEWIVEAPWSSGVLPLADFGTVTINGAQTTIGGHTGAISDSNWTNEAITMVTSSGTPKAVPSGLSTTKTGSSFSVTWQHQ